MISSRYPYNPILTKDDVPYPVAAVHNAAVIKHLDKYVMAFRSHKLNGRSILGKAVNADGYHIKLDKEPFMNGEYLMTYSAYSRHEVRIGLSKTRDGETMQYHWDEMKIGSGASPILTARGWIHMYQGVSPTMDGCVYSLGAALHQLDDPSTIIAVGDDWSLQPEKEYEITGYVHNVVFCCGTVPAEDGSVKIYWGGADRLM